MTKLYFRLRITENGKVIDERDIVDPFIHTTLTLGHTFWQRARAAWETLRGKEFVLSVGGDHAATGDVMQLIDSWETKPPTREGPSQLRVTDAVRAAVRASRGGMDAPAQPEGFA